MTLSDYWANHPVGSRPLTVSDWGDFNRWLETMRRQVANLAKDSQVKWPIYGKHRKTRRKVYFWPNGETMTFTLDEHGCVTGDDIEREKALVKPSERHAMTTSKLSRAEVVKAQLKALQAEMAALARFPEDNFPEHTVLMTQKTIKRAWPTRRPDGVGYTWDPNTGETVDQVYTYVLLKVNGQWWMTGQNSHQINGASWDKVIDFVDGDELIDVRTGLSVMTDAETIADHIGEEAAAKVDEFLKDPSTGSFLSPRIAERPTRDES